MNTGEDRFGKPFQSKKSVYFSLLTGIWPGERFALDSIHRHNIITINSLRENLGLLIDSRRNSQTSATGRGREKDSPLEDTRQNPLNSLFADVAVPFRRNEKRAREKAEAYAQAQTEGKRALDAAPRLRRIGSPSRIPATLPRVVLALLPWACGGRSKVVSTTPGREFRTGDSLPPAPERPNPKRRLALRRPDGSLNRAPYAKDGS
jgi:hypothetical protein